VDSFGEKPMAKKSHASVPLTNDAKTFWVKNICSKFM
jgi:hypothetical protein